MAELTEEEKADAKKKATADAKKAATETKADATEESAVTPKKFSELSLKDKLVIKNTNGEDTQVTKTYWQTVRNAELDRLQGIKLLGLYVKDGDDYKVEPIEDDSEIEDL